MVLYSRAHQSFLYVFLDSFGYRTDYQDYSYNAHHARATRHDASSSVFQQFVLLFFYAQNFANKQKNGTASSFFPSVKEFHTLFTSQA